MRQILIGFCAGLCLAQASSLTACQKLALCSLEKCVNVTWAKTPAKEELMESLVDRVDFGCIYGPSCYDACVACDTCDYGMRQIRNIVVEQKSEGQCIEMEKCTLECFSDQVRRRSPWECFRRQCAPMCFDRRSCPTCYDTMRAIFAGFCYREGYNLKFKQQCRELFDSASTDFVFKRRRVV